MGSGWGGGGGGGGGGDLLRTINHLKGLLNADFNNFRFLSSPQPPERACSDQPVMASTIMSYRSVSPKDKGRWSPGFRRGSLATSREESYSSLDSVTCSSTSSSLSSLSPSSPGSKQCVSDTLDKYVTASTEGREAYSRGNLREAVTDFNHALALELQTELDCLYDNSIGFMSGLVRTEVDSRLPQVHQGDSSSIKCSHILRQLRENYYKAVDGLEKKNTEAKWYLQMGASLVMINEWEKAKAVYIEGINMCKDRKALKHALKNLIRTEQMTSFADIPVEDQPERQTNASSPCESPVSSPHHSPPHYSPNHSPDPSPKHSSDVSPLKRSATPYRRRNRSKSIGVKVQKQSRNRSTSIDLECKKMVVEEPRRKSDATLLSSPALGARSSNKRSSFGIFNFKQRAALSQDTTLAWSNCFDPTGCKVFSQEEFQPSAIKHMRALSSLHDGACKDTDSCSENNNDQHDQLLNSGRFNAIHFRSMRIEDDDSELDESD